MTTKRKYKTLILASDLNDFLLERSQLKLQVHSVFETSANLLAKDELITLATNGRELMPMGCILDLRKIQELNLKTEDVVFYKNESFQLPQGEIICLQNAEIKNLNLKSFSENHNAIDIAALELIKRKLLEKDSGGIAHLVACLPGTGEPDCTLNIYSRYIKQDLFLFMDFLKKRDYEAAGYLSERLIGFGPGLTPSCDDFLAGIILLLYYKEADNCFFQKIVSLASERTTTVSYHMLKNAAMGKAYESYLDLIRALSGKDLISLPAMVNRILRFGASSGSDFLFGVYCAGLLIYERENAKVVNWKKSDTSKIS